MTASLTLDQQRGLRDVPEPWRPFLADWRQDCAEIIETGIDPRFPAAVIEGRRQRDCDIIELRELGHTYLDIAEMLELSPTTVSSILNKYRPDLARLINA